MVIIAITGYIEMIKPGHKNLSFPKTINWFTFTEI